ncbi:hypothetical protein H2200_005738 [Cladophialophora chaetospira]|uniref:F-box domain-containing protein n=1 Tax=Cladophialophora chaetospira TaxID=386627 RepID=A0AA38X9T5_9EURO|nr:hypothetical protein H2200_005738 [Cladophialophora chaetospira]
MADAQMIRPRNLFDLPNEILLNLVENLVDEQQPTKQTLSSFRQTCKHASRLAEQTWWRHIQLRSHRHYETLVFLLNGNELPLAHIQELEIVPVAEQAETITYRHKDRFISLCRDLRCLTVDTGFEWACRSAMLYELRLPAHRFPELRECELSFSESRECCRASFMNILEAPKLITLTLDTIDLRGPPEGTLSDRASPLKILKLRNCAVDDSSITVVLRKPSALKVLEFGLAEPDMRQFMWSTRADQELRVFDKLPSGIERIKIHAGGGYEMAELAGVLLDSHSCGLGLPISVRHLEFSTRSYHQRPFDKEDQIADDELHRGITRLMAESFLVKLDYTQRHYTPEEDRRHRELKTSDDLIWDRRLIAERKTGNEVTDTFDHESKDYTLEEVLVRPVAAEPLGSWAD